MSVGIENKSVEALEDFSDGAKAELNRACEEYRINIIDETRKIEQRDRGRDDEVEIIAVHVREAKRNYRKTSPKKASRIIINVILDLLILIVGIIFDKEKMLNNDIYLIGFIVLLLTTIVLTVIKYSKEWWWYVKKQAFKTNKYYN